MAHLDVPRHATQIDTGSRKQDVDELHFYVYLYERLYYSIESPSVDIALQIVALPKRHKNTLLGR